MKKLWNYCLIEYDTPIGVLLVVADQDGNLRAVDWDGLRPRMRRLLRRHYGENGFKLIPAAFRMFLRKQSAVTWRAISVPSTNYR